MAFTQRDDGSIVDEKGGLVQGAFDLSKGIKPSTTKGGKYLLGVRDGELQFGDLPNTTGGTSKTRFSRLSDGEQPTFDSLYGNARQAEIERQAGQIANVEKVFGERLQRETRREEEFGKRNEARASTIAAMTGNAGGVNATTRLGREEKRTKENVSLVEQQVAADKAAALSAIYGRIDQNASRAAEIQLSANREDQERLRQETATNALNNILSFAQEEGVTYDDFAAAYKSDPDLQGEVERTGRTLAEIYELYTSAQPAPPKKTYTWKGNNLVVVQENADGSVSTQTFDSSDLGIPKGSDIGTVTVGDSVYWYDKDEPLSADGTPSLIRLGARPGAKGGDDETGADIPDFDTFVDEFITTPEGQAIIGQYEKSRQQTLTPDARRDIVSKEIRGIYDEATSAAIEAGGTDYQKARKIVSDSAEGERDWFKLKSRISEATKLPEKEIEDLLKANGLAEPKEEETDDLEDLFPEEGNG